MEFQRYRLINERKGIFGLYFSDLIVACTLFVVMNFIFEGTSIQIICFIIPIVAIGCLVPIRKKYRKGIVRTFLKYWVRGKVIYDPRNI